MAVKVSIDLDVLLKAFQQMCYLNEMAMVYDEHRDLIKYVHSTSRGHEAIQLAVGMQLLPNDYAYPYYRDEAMIMSLGMTPYEMMLQSLAKKNDPFSGGRLYYAHPSLRRDNQTKIPYQSSATGMQAIPATGAAHGIKYKENNGLVNYLESGEIPPVVVCSMGDGAITEGEVSEAFQMAVLHKLPIIYLIQDNGWSISAYRDEFAAMNAVEFALGFKGLETHSVDGADFFACYEVFQKILDTVRLERRPMLLHARVPLIGHHTSGVRREWYRPKDEYEQALLKDPTIIMRNRLIELGLDESYLDEMDWKARSEIHEILEKIQKEEDPDDIRSFYYKPTPITEEKGERNPAGASEIVMVDAALHALDTILKTHPEALLYGQDVGGTLGGVFREAATLAGKYGKTRVFNTPIQEAYIIGSTSGMSAVGLKPVVEVQFADYLWPGLNQLFTEISRSYYLSNGKWPIQTLIRVPIGSYGSGGPFHSSSIESVVLKIHGVKVVYPSNAADMKGLFKAAFYDPNPVVIFEHKGLYWSKVPGTKEAKTPEPDDDYIIPLGKGRIVQEAAKEEIERGNTCVVITYGMGVHWARNASRQYFDGQVEIIDLRTLEPIDWPLITEAVMRHGKVAVLTEENYYNSFAEALAGRISRQFFRYLDSPVMVLGSENTPCIPLNTQMEAMVLPSAEKLRTVLDELLNA